MADPLVFLPGMMCDARLFAPQIADLGRDHAIMVAPISAGERIEEMASAILSWVPPKFALAGLSMGGIVAMEVIRRAPERVTRLCLMDTNPLGEVPQVAANRDLQMVRVKAGRLEDVMRDEMKPNYLAPGVGRMPVLHEVMQMAMGLGAEVFIRQSRALQRRRDQQGTLRRIKVPTLVMCGEYDTLCPVKRHELMAELIPYARLQVIEGAGHLPTLEQPEAVKAALRTWMKQPFVLQ